MRLDSPQWAREAEGLKRVNMQNMASKIKQKRKEDSEWKAQRVKETPKEAGGG